jgi:S1/P1 nuclease
MSMRRPRIRLAIGLVALLPAVALAWGEQGHRAIATVAAGRLGTATRAKVAALLPGGQTLADVATWADEVRDAAKGTGPLANDPEAKAFNASFPKNRDWHFVNLALDATAYSAKAVGASTNDAVHAIARCIKVLEAPADTPGFSRLEALRLLVHFVGDLHQPLHAATGYYDLTGTQPVLVTDPARARGLQDDQGGNLLCLHQAQPNGHCQGGDNLHSLWDTRLVEQLAGGSSVTRLATLLRGKLGNAAWRAAHAAALADPSGDYHRWAEAWAADSTAEARAAYQPIVFATPHVHGGGLVSIEVTPPPTYASDQLDRATTRLAAAAAHLAHVLNRVRFP